MLNCISRRGFAPAFLFWFLLSSGAAIPPAAPQVPSPLVEDPFVPTDRFVPYEYDHGAGFRNDVHVSRAARARVLGATPWHPLPDFDANGWIQLGDLVQSATNELYQARLVGGATRWVSIGGGTTINVTAEVEYLPFSVRIAEASNAQEIVVPDVPAGKAVEAIYELTLGIPIPRRCVRLGAADGKNYDRFWIQQPYCWFDTNMYAAGVAKLMDATP